MSSRARIRSAETRGSTKRALPLRICPRRERALPGKNTVVVVAYSGGLDTSYLVARLAREEKARVIAVTVDTGGFTKEDLERIEARAEELGAAKHMTIDARAEVFEKYVSYLKKKNVLRGNVYPLSVA